MICKNGTSEDFNIGWFAYIHCHHGTWTQIGDTLIMNFDEKKGGLLDEKVIFKGNNLFKIQADRFVLTHYYLGYCKGLN